MVYPNFFDVTHISTNQSNNINPFNSSMAVPSDPTWLFLISRGYFLINVEHSTLNKIESNVIEYAYKQL